MQTSLARRERRRRNGNGRHGGGGAGRGIAVALPVFLFASLAVLALTSFVGVVAGYGFFARDLPDPKAVFANLAFSQQTVVLDATGKVELARFGDQKRELVPFADIPPVLIDATTSIEDKTFWTNAGFDPLAFVKATFETLAGSERGASTITQQLTRARLLPQSAFTGSKYERKAKEIIQSIRLTQAYPGDEGKKAIMEAYLNQNFFGNQSYGIKAAAKSYFGITDLSTLTIAQAAVLAAIPQSPSTYDLVANAVKVTGADGKETLVVPADTAIAKRRDLVLDRMLQDRVLTRDAITDEQIEAAKREPITLVRQAGTNWRAPHFVWQVRKEVARIICGSEESCDRLDNGGYVVTTTLDWSMQRSAEKWVKAAVVAPNAKDPAATLKSLKAPNAKWIQNLVGKDVRNGALIAIDYRTGRILAYVGSANYYAESTNPKFQPKYDVLADGWRQPGSAMKPINYITGIEGRTLTAASMLMDVATDFGGDYVPLNADKLERGPLRVRQALSFSLNIPAVKAAIEIGPDNVFTMAKRFGLTFQSKENIAGSSIALGTLEVHPTELVSAYGAIANGGVLVPRTTISRIVDNAGNQVWPAADAPAPVGTQVVSKQSAFIITDILDGNTNPKSNPYWGKFQIETSEGTRRPAALKTGTTNDTKDLAAYGFLAPPDDPTAPALAVGVWMGNSDNSMTEGVFSLDSTAPLWQSFLAEVSKKMPIATFKKPDGIVEADVDAFSGLLPGPFTTATVRENFIAGTEPKRVDDTKVALEVDAATGLLWSDGCTGPKELRGFLDLSRVEENFPAWRSFTDDWIARARKGPGTAGGPGETKARTSYFYNGAYQPYGATWGAPFAPTESCLSVPPPCDPTTGICPPAPCDPTLGSPCPSPPCDPATGPCQTPSPTPPPIVAIPPLFCLDRNAATQALAAEGLLVGSIAPGNAGPDWVVESSNPDEGTELPAGTAVNLKLAEKASLGCP